MSYTTSSQKGEKYYGIYFYRKEDIGSAKAEVAAAFVNKRVEGCKVTPYCNRIEDFDEAFYKRTYNYDLPSSFFQVHLDLLSRQTQTQFKIDQVFAYSCYPIYHVRAIFLKKLFAGDKSPQFEKTL